MNVNFLFHYFQRSDSSYECVTFLFNAFFMSSTFADFHLLQEHDMVMRVVNGFQRLCQAVKLAPEIWMAMFLRLAVKHEVHTFALDLISALMIHFSHKIPVTFWICISRFLHELTKKDSSVEL